LAKIYRIIQQWNHWLTQFLGKSLLEYEQQAVALMQSGKYGNSTLLLGVPHQVAFLKSGLTPNKFLLSPIHDREMSCVFIEGDFYELPIHTGSVDQVILPHTLELLDNPHKLLSEACRIVKPEGYIYITGFNPYSLWGLKKCFTKNEGIPWSRNFISASTIKKWLELADFELQEQNMVLFRPATQHYSLYQKLKFLEWVGNKCYKPLGGVYILKAQAKVIPLSPIRLHWTQELSGVRMSTGTLPGPSIRNN
jgi:SAM-dependent methyltransferase